MNQRGHAVELCKAGFRVFPLAENTKDKPLGKWKEIATNEQPKVAHFWSDPDTKLPLGRNIGIFVDSDVVVIDVDVREGRKGAASMRLLKMLHGDLPETYTVETWSGGRHLFFRLPGPTQLKSQLAENIDLKGGLSAGYAAGEGSTIDGKAYRRIAGDPNKLAMLPEAWLEAMLRPEREPAKGAAPLVELDTPGAIERATECLMTAPPAVQGDGGDHATYATAARVMDFGISAPTALELMLDHWNDRCSPPWRPDELKVKVDHAAAYRQNPVGIAAPEAEFEAVELVEPKPSDRFDFQPVEPFELGSIPPRRWVLDRLAARTFVTGLIAPPGTGKTTLLTMIAVAVATGRDDILGFKVRERTRVLLWNQEDDQNELRRRLAAVMTAFDVRWEDFVQDGRRMLFLESGVLQPLMFTKRSPGGNVEATEAAKNIGQFVSENDIGLAIFDPFSELHSVENENDNARMRAASGVFRDQVAVGAECAVVLAHHTRKPPQADAKGMAGNMDSGRGASSLVGVFRISPTLFTVDTDTAKKYGIAEAERHLYVRLDDAKSNLSLISGEPAFFRREGVLLGGVGGESVGVLRPTTLARAASAKDKAREDLIEEVFAILESAGAMPVREVARELIKLPLRSDTNADALAKEIGRVFASEVERDKAVISKETRSLEGRAGRHAVLVYDAGL